LPVASISAVGTGVGVVVLFIVGRGVTLGWQGFGNTGVGVGAPHVGVAVAVFGVTTANALGVVP